jgi:hypothetical protein
MMKRVAFPVVVFLAMLCLSGYAAAYSLDLEGRPAAFEPGRTTGYFIWQDSAGLHLRTTTDGSSRVFSGTIRTDGAFRDTFGKSNGGGDDSFRVSGDRGTITFRFTNLGDEAGIDMHIADGTYVAFDLSMDGYGLNPADIHIGGDGWHPGDRRFTLRPDGDPDRARYVNDRTVIIVRPNFWWRHRHWGLFWGPPPHHHHHHHHYYRHHHHRNHHHRHHRW